MDRIAEEVEALIRTTFNQKPMLQEMLRQAHDRYREGALSVADERSFLRLITSDSWEGLALWLKQRF